MNEDYSVPLRYAKGRAFLKLVFLIIICILAVLITLMMELPLYMRLIPAGIGLIPMGLGITYWVFLKRDMISFAVVTVKDKKRNFLSGLSSGNLFSGYRYLISYKKGDGSSSDFWITRGSLSNLHVGGEYILLYYNRKEIAADNVIGLSGLIN